MRSNPSTGAIHAKLARVFDCRDHRDRGTGPGSGATAGSLPAWTVGDRAKLQPDASGQETVYTREHSPQHGLSAVAIPGESAAVSGLSATVSGVPAAVPGVSAAISGVPELPAVGDARGHSAGRPALHGAHGWHRPGAL